MAASSRFGYGRASMSPTPPNSRRTPQDTDTRGLPRRPEGAPSGVTRSPHQHELAHAFAIAAARSLRDDKCDNIVVLDLKGHSPVTAFFVIGSGTSPRQMRTAGRSVEELGESMDMAAFGHNLREQDPTWVIIDCVDVVVHIFEPETRAFYDLEMLWNDAERIPWDDGKGPSRDPRAEEPDPDPGYDDDEAITDEDYAAAASIDDSLDDDDEFDSAFDEDPEDDDPHDR